MSTYKSLLSVLLLSAAFTACAPPDVSGATSCVTHADCVGGYVCQQGTCTPACVPTTCAALGKNCGQPSDGCGGTLNCGSCSGSETCGGAGVANVCGEDPGCTPESGATFCSRLGKNCGVVVDENNCGNTRQVDCGSCSGTDSCGGGGTPNVCGEGATCTPETNAALCSRLGKNCDQISATDNCGNSRELNCGACAGSETCGGGGTPNVCGDDSCVPEADGALCARFGKNCGAFTAEDNCGDSRTVSCGACTDPDTCAGGGTVNVCGQAGCTSETTGAFCSRLQKNCGVVTAPDNCGVGRSVNCGSCSSPESCGGDNVCACLPESDAQFCSRLSLACGGFSGMDNCGQPRSVTSCGTCGSGQVCGTDNTCGCGTCGSNAHCDATAQRCICDGGYIGDGQSCGLQDRCAGRLETELGGFCYVTPVAPLETFEDVFGTSANSVWAVGYSKIARWDGSRWWVESSTVGGSAVWASSASDVWVVGSEGGVLHRDATSWSSVTPDSAVSYYGVWGSGPNDVWVVGHFYNTSTSLFEGVAYRWNGTAWSSRINVANFGLQAVWGSGPNDVWVTGNSCTVMRWNGTSWSPTTLPTSVCSGYTVIGDISGSGSSDVWMVSNAGLLRWNGSTWSSIPLSFRPDDIHVASGTRAYAVGQNTTTYEGSAAVWDGASWTPADLPVDTERLKGVWGDASGRAVAGGNDGSLVLREPLGWRDTTTFFKSIAYGTAVDGSSPANVLIATREGVFRWNGSSWSEASAGLPSSTWRRDINVLSPTSAWLNVDDDVYRWNGTTWSSTGLSGPTYIGGLSMASPSEGWAVGGGASLNSGSTYRWNGTSWTAVSNPAQGTLSSVWALSATEAWAVGDRSGNGTDVLRWNGSAWTPLTTPITKPQFVTGSGSNDVWVLDWTGRVYHWNGSAWALTNYSSGGNADFFHLVAVSPTLTYGTNGTAVYRWTGSGWEYAGDVSPSHTINAAHGIWASPAGDIWTVGLEGTITTNLQ